MAPQARKPTNAWVRIINDFIDILLRDASIRIGLGMMKADPQIWSKLLDPTNMTSFNRNLKKLNYAINYLLDHKTLTNSFQQFFEEKAKITYEAGLIIIKDNGKLLTLQDCFKNKIKNFRSSVHFHTGKQYKLKSSKHENECGGRGIKLERKKSLEEKNSKRREKRAKYKKGKTFYLNRMPAGDLKKEVKVRKKAMMI